MFHDEIVEVLFRGFLVSSLSYSLIIPSHV